MMGKQEKVVGWAQGPSLPLHYRQPGEDFRPAVAQIQSVKCPN